MGHRRRSLFACALVLTCLTSVLGQAAPRDIFLVCGSQPNEPTVYFSGVLQGSGAALQGFRNGFATFLGQRYGYKGAVGCEPANTAATAQTFLNSRAAALRNQKKTVIETGWSEPAAVAAAPTAPSPAPPARQATTAAGGGSRGSSGGGSGVSSAGGSSGSSDLSSILGAIFGNGGGAGASGATAGGAGHATGSANTPGATSATSATSATGATGATGDQGGPAQVASTLATVFSSKSTGDSGAGAQSAPSAEGLGSAQAQNTKLVVYGCGRQDTQVACVTELTNQNQNDTLVQSAAVWQDTFVVDDRGDRHPRSNGFFLNIDGDQRSQIDISYGGAARFILMFDGVPTKVQKVGLRSTAAGLDVEAISLVAPAAGAPKH